MNLAAAIASWDGRSADDIATVYKEFSGQQGFSESLPRLLQVKELQAGASWLLKAWLEQGGRLNDRDTASFFQSLQQLQHWNARLHSLQCLAYLAIPDDCEISLERYLRQHLTHENKFVRAWAYNGFALLSNKNPDYREQAEALFEMAMRDEAASVKARIRQIRKSN